MSLFDVNDPDELRYAIEQEREMRIAYATQLCAIVEQGDDPLLAALAASFRASGVREKRLRNALKTMAAG